MQANTEPETKEINLERKVVKINGVGWGSYRYLRGILGPGDFIIPMRLSKMSDGAPEEEINLERKVVKLNGVMWGSYGYLKGVAGPGDFLIPMRLSKMSDDIYVLVFKVVNKIDVTYILVFKVVKAGGNS